MITVCSKALLEIPFQENNQMEKGLEIWWTEYLHMIVTTWALNAFPWGLLSCVVGLWLLQFYPPERVSVGNVRLPQLHWIVDSWFSSYTTAPFFKGGINVRPWVSSNGTNECSGVCSAARPRCSSIWALDLVVLPFIRCLIWGGSAFYLYSKDSPNYTWGRIHGTRVKTGSEQKDLAFRLNYINIYLSCFIIYYLNACENYSNGLWFCTHYKVEQQCQQ